VTTFAELKAFDSEEDLFSRAAERFFEILAEGTGSGQPVLRVALSGGTTPSHLFRRLLHLDCERIDWKRIRLFQVDERCIPSDDPRSNFALADRELLAPLADRIGETSMPEFLRMRGEEAPETAAAEYDRLLRDELGEQGRGMDLILLGAGPDGHTASLFTGAPELSVRDRLAVATQDPWNGLRRITLTYPVLNGTKHVLMLTSGPTKEPVVRAARAKEYNANHPWPALRLQPRALEWFAYPGSQ